MGSKKLDSRFHAHRTMATCTGIPSLSETITLSLVELSDPGALIVSNAEERIALREEAQAKSDSESRPFGDNTL